MGLSASKKLSSGLKHCTLWKADRSPACRAVMMSLDAMNLSVTEVDINIDKEEHKTPQMLSVRNFSFNIQLFHSTYPCYPILYGNCKYLNAQQIMDIECTYYDLECMLVGKCWFGGSWATLSDIIFASSVSTLNILVPVDKYKFPRLSGWLYRVSEELFYVTANKKGLCEFTKRIGELPQVQKS
ncbi:hypothetical protein HF086_003583 [Spodoptera exigua]|uniref:Uncharacterized protein n=1 Tax=Spodoptera exigua TaxID=7107 RepID=A0A922MN27_SPOEX|nr:hypothetical protein HF086_003583 [Spodoptera exigua]